MSIAFYYILTVIVLGLLPVLLFFQLPNMRLLTRITPPSSFNLDTQQNNQFTITGQVQGAFHQVFIDIYQKNLYQIGPINFSHFRWVKTIPVDEEGKFKVSSLDGGEYLLAPKSLPMQKIYFSKKYFLQLADHNPQPVIIAGPSSSVWQFAIDTLGNSSYYK